MDAPRSPQGMLIDLLHAELVVNMLGVTRVQQNVSMALHGTNEQGNRSCQTLRKFRLVRFPISRFSVSRVASRNRKQTTIQ